MSIKPLFYQKIPRVSMYTPRRSHRSCITPCNTVRLANADVQDALTLEAGFKHPYTQNILLSGHPIFDSTIPDYSHHKKPAARPTIPMAPPATSRAGLAAPGVELADAAPPVADPEVPPLLPEPDPPLPPAEAVAEAWASNVCPNVGSASDGCTIHTLSVNAGQSTPVTEGE